MAVNTKYTEIAAQDLDQWQKAGETIYIVDTLPAGVFEKRKIPGAHNACVYEVTFLEQIEKIVPDRRQKIVVYGSSQASLDAPSAAEKLVRAGFEAVFVLTGGIAAWRAGGFALEGNDVAFADSPPEKVAFGDGEYAVDIDESIIEWTGRNPNTRHYGSVRLSGGTLTAQDNIFSGSFEIDMDSIENVNLKGDDLYPVLIAHLKSDDFFFVKLFPKAAFNIRRARPVEAPQLSSPNYEIEGRLELRGISGELNFPATLNHGENGDIIAEAHFDFDRTRWNVIYGSSRFFEHLGMHLVFDPISIQVRVVARPVKS